LDELAQRSALPPGVGVPLASAYTVTGNIGLLQSGSDVIALFPSTSTGVIATALIAQALPDNGFWTVTLQCKWTPTTGASQYPGVGVCVATGVTSGVSVGYDESQYCTGAALDQHGQEFTVNGARTSVFNDNIVSSMSSGGLWRARLLNDGTNLHFQWSCDGIVWTDSYSMACPAGLGYYGFSMGNGAGTGATGECQMDVVDNTYRGALTVPQKAVSAVSNASPIQITTSTNHGFVTGDIVAVLGTGVANANSGVGNGNFSWRVIVNGLNTFLLVGSSAGGAAGAGGTATCISR